LDFGFAKEVVEPPPLESRLVVFLRSAMGSLDGADDVEKEASSSMDSYANRACSSVKGSPFWTEKSLRKTWTTKRKEEVHISYSLDEFIVSSCVFNNII